MQRGVVCAGGEIGHTTTTSSGFKASVMERPTLLLFRFEMRDDSQSCRKLLAWDLWQELSTCFE